MRRDIKVLYLNYMQDLYGSSIGSTIKAIELLSALNEYGFKILFEWRCAQSSSQPGQKDRKNVTHYPALLFLIKRAADVFRDFIAELGILKKAKPDLLVVRLDAFRVSGIFLSRIFRLPLLVEADNACSYEWIHFHNIPRSAVPFLFKAEKYLLREATGVFTQSQVTQHYLTSTHRITPEKFREITNGAKSVDRSVLTNRQKWMQKLGISENNLVIGFVGSMHHWHGMKEMKKSISDILADYQQVKFLFVGSGGAQARSFRKRFHQNKDRVIFSGSVDHEQVPELISLFSISLAPYPNMPFFYFSPVKLFEYMAAGTAIVAARIGQIAAVIAHEKTGLLYEPGNIPMMKNQIIRLIEDRKLRLTLGADAKKEFKQHHTWQHKASELNEFIRKRINVR